MRQILILAFILSTIIAKSQQDTVFLKYNKDWTSDSINYTTDTIVFDSGMKRHILSGTTILPWTHNQQCAKGYGLYFKQVSKSDCLQNEKAYGNVFDRVNSIHYTDSTLTIDCNIYDNCCYDFLCDISVSEQGILNLIYHGYGTYCACDCCFGLIYHFKLQDSDEYKEIKAVIINNDPRTKREIKHSCRTSPLVWCN